MPHLQVKDIDENLYRAIKHRASLDHRSVSQEVVSMVEKCLAMPATKAINATREFIDLAGSWGDDRSAHEIVSETRKNRKKTSRFGITSNVFD